MQALASHVVTSYLHKVTYMIDIFSLQAVNTITALYGDYGVIITCPLTPRHAYASFDFLIRLH